MYLIARVSITKNSHNRLLCHLGFVKDNNHSFLPMFKKKMTTRKDTVLVIII